MTNARPLIFGELLLDRFPDGREIPGGAPFNVAWHLQGFGASPLLVSRVGMDGAGDRALATMRAWGLDLAAVERDPGRRTGVVEVAILDGEPSYHMDPDQAYGHIEGAGAIGAGGPSLIYHGTLALWSPPSRRSWARLRRMLDAPMFVDLNLRAPWWDLDLACACLDSATWAKLSIEELDQVAGGSAPVAARAAELRLRHGLRRVIITMSERGAMVIDGDGSAFAVPASTPGPVVDTVGAGDAFSAVMILGELAGWDLPLTLGRAAAFAGAVCGQRGATVADHGLYAQFLEEWSRG